MKAMDVDEALAPREGAKWIAENSGDVKIMPHPVRNLAQKIFGHMKNEDEKVGVDRWQFHMLNPKTQDEAAIDWVFLTDVLNFSFWAEEEEKCVVEYGGTSWTGYWALCAAINRALEENNPITNPKFYRTLNLDMLKHILRSDSPHSMPMLEERLVNLHEAGNVLVEKYGGAFNNVVRECNRSAQKLVELVLRDFPSFRDEVVYKGKKVLISKRVQILVGDIWACCSGKGLGEFNDIDNLTIFADYRIPQALAYFGLLEYSDGLMEKLKKKSMLKYGEREEVEIRGCSIWAVEMLVEEIKRLMAADQSLPEKKMINSVIVDHYLWDIRREKAEEMADVPFHRVRCIYY